MLFEHWRQIVGSREETVAMSVCFPLFFDLAFENMRGCNVWGSFLAQRYFITISIIFEYLCVRTLKIHQSWIASSETCVAVAFEGHAIQNADTL